jgi:hypothetical protein
MNIIITFLILQGEMFEYENVLRFADYLYSQENFDGAVNEYRRYIFLTESTHEDILEKIVDCLVRLERFDEAIKESVRFQDEKRDYTKGWVYFIAGEYDSSRRYLNRVGVPYKENADKLIGLGYAHDFRFREAGNFIRLPVTPPVYKKPELGALFSIFPGGGHFYCGRIGDGLFSLFVVGTSALLSYYYYDRDEDLKFGVALGATILFYTGNIYGGINAVRNYNYYQNEQYLRRILEEAED